MDWPAPLTVRELSAELRCSEDEVRALIRDEVDGRGRGVQDVVRGSGA
ncbi:MAG TPA: hypothetical protein VGP69_11430 [Gaiellaceae bacterium]|jgi:hypothetical protein|nr:hypothetical protein [Gaiellaceae bacterium]